MFGNIDYNIYRCDRDPKGGKTRGSGVVTLISKECNSEMIYKNNKNYEILITLNKTGVKNLIIINVYLPPLSDFDCYCDFINKIDMIKEKYKHFDLLISSDFNLAKCYFTFI